MSVEDKSFRSLGWILDPQQRLVDETVLTHWAILNKIRSGGFYELDPQQQRMLFQGSFNVASYSMGGFNGTRSLIAALEREHGLDMSTSRLLEADAQGHSAMLANIRAQLLSPKSSLPNDLLLANAVAQALATINPPDFEALRPVSGEGRNAGADVVGNDENLHIRPIHSFKYADYPLQVETLFHIGNVFKLELPDGTPVVSERGDGLIPPQVNTGRDASILLGYGIVALEQALVEQVLSRVLENDDGPCRQTLQSIGDAIGESGFADNLIVTGKQICDQHRVPYFGLGRQHENCKTLVSFVRTCLGIERVADLVGDLVGQGQIDASHKLRAAEMHESLKKIWLAADRIHALSSVPYMGAGINSVMTPVIGKLCPSLLPQVEGQSLGKERINAKAMQYQPRIRGNAVPVEGNTAAAPPSTLEGVLGVQRSVANKQQKGVSQ